MDPKLLDILACPACKGKLEYSKEAKEIVCQFDRVAFQIKSGIPVMLMDEARPLAPDEYKNKK